MSFPDNLARAVSRHRAEGAVAATSLNNQRRYAVTGAFDTPDVLVRLASVTKPMVAMAALLTRGAESLDRPLVDDVPDLAESWRADPAITLRHVLSHTSGLHPDRPLDVLFGLGDGDDALAAAVRQAVGAGQRFPLGAAWEYCNAGYWLAGAALETLTGTTFEEFLATALFDPLGMARTTFEHEQGSYPRARRPSGGLWSTASDVLSFAEFALADPRARAALDVMSRPITDSYLGSPYGLALQVGEDMVWHNGDFGPFNTRLTLVPSRGYAAFVAVRGEIRRHVIDEVMRAELRALGLPGPPTALVRAPMTARSWLRLRRAVRSS